MVHRVGNTLLLDDFDVHSHLLRQQKCEWAWLNNFYIDTVLENLQEKIKVSYFLFGWFLILILMYLYFSRRKICAKS